MHGLYACVRVYGRKAARTDARPRILARRCRQPGRRAVSPKSLRGPSAQATETARLPGPHGPPSVSMSRALSEGRLRLTQGWSGFKLVTATGGDTAWCWSKTRAMPMRAKTPGPTVRVRRVPAVRQGGVRQRLSLGPTPAPVAQCAFSLQETVRDVSRFPLLFGWVLPREALNPILVNKMQDFRNLVLHNCILIFDAEHVYFKFKSPMSRIRKLQQTRIPNPRKKLIFRKP